MESSERMSQSMACFSNVFQQVVGQLPTNQGGASDAARTQMTWRCVSVGLHGNDRIKAASGAGCCSGHQSAGLLGVGEVKDFLSALQ